MTLTADPSSLSYDERWLVVSTDRAAGMVHTRPVRHVSLRRFRCEILHATESEINNVLAEFDANAGAVGVFSWTIPGTSESVRVRFVEDSLSVLRLSAVSFHVAWELQEVRNQ